jgi:hypothetical protein
LIETTFYLPVSFACGRSDWGNLEEELKKIKILFTGMVGPYREIFLSVLKTSLGLRPRGPFLRPREIFLYTDLQSGK